MENILNNLRRNLKLIIEKTKRNDDTEHHWLYQLNYTEVVRLCIALSGAPNAKDEVVQNFINLFGLLNREDYTYITDQKTSGMILDQLDKEEYAR